MAIIGYTANKRKPLHSRHSHNTNIPYHIIIIITTTTYYYNGQNNDGNNTKYYDA